MNDFCKDPYLQLPLPDSMTVMWETETPCRSVVEVYRAQRPHCGEAVYRPQGEAKVFTGEPGTVHRVTLTGLESGADYVYRVLPDERWPQTPFFESDFRTAPLPGSPVSFCVTSETGGAKSAPRLRQGLVENIAGERPDFIFFPGDMVLDGRRARDWDEYLFTPFRELICHTPFYHCAGNHEEDSDLMRRYLATPEQGYYAFDYGCAHFVALDTPKLSTHNPTPDGDLVIEPNEPLKPGQAQYDFLARDLAASQAAWKVVFMHYPPYFSGTWEAPSLRPLCRLFERYGVDLVICSHAIVYERSHPITADKLDFNHGVRYIVAGGAGAKPSWFDHKKAWHTARSAATPHYLHISMTPTHMEFQAVNDQGQLFDTMTLEK